MAVQKDYSDVRGTERWFWLHYLLGAFLEIVDAGEKRWAWHGGRHRRGTHCTLDGTLCICPVGGKPLTVCILHERSKNPYCHASVDSQVVTK